MAEHLIYLDCDSPLNLQTQIREKLVEAILSRVFSVGQRLPSSRKLADQLGVARNTVTLAYQQLIDEGYLVSRERSGIYVNDSILEGQVGIASTSRSHSSAYASVWRSRLSGRISLPSTFKYPPNWQQYPYPFIDGLYDHSLFPVAEWREATRLSLGIREINAWTSCDGEADDKQLLEQLRTKVLPRRGILAEADEILITIGSQQALFILIQLLVTRGTSVVVEEPGCPGLRQLLASRGAALRHQPVDDDGMVVDTGMDRAEVVCVTPSHQLPTAVTMSLERRQHLLQAAQQSDFVIIEDDRESESNVLGNPHPALKSLDQQGRVIYLSSLSKALSPALRLGFMVAPAEVIAEARRLRSLMVKYPASNNQRAAALFLSLGHYDAAMKRVGQIFSDRWLALRDALNHYLPQLVVTSRAQGGTACWVQLPEGIDISALLQQAASRGILLEPVDHYYAVSAGRQTAVRLGVTSISIDRIRSGVAELATLLRAMDAGEQERLSLPLGECLQGAALQKALSGATLILQTVYGQPLTIHLHDSGTMTGYAGFAHEESDEGCWWVEGNYWVRRWQQWAYGEELRLQTVIKDEVIHWYNPEGVLVDRAVLRRPDSLAMESPPVDIL